MQQKQPQLDEWRDASIATLSQAMADGRLTSVQLTQYYLDRIAAYNPQLNAIQSLNVQALSAAAELDAERQRSGPRSPLHGIAVLVKDNYETVEMPTSAGSALFAGFNPGRDATLVARLRAAGAVILGKTTMHEFAYGITTVGSAFGAAANPYDTRRNPGGSSGGSGAAASANFAAVTMGSDTCGSIRIPAAHNNLVGLRGTQGLSSRAGIVPLSGTQDIGGPIARSTHDLALVLDATVGFDPADAQTAVMQQRPAPDYAGQLQLQPSARIGILSDWMVQAPVDQAVASQVRAALQAMTQATGWITVELASPALNASVDRAWNGHLVLISDFYRDINAYLQANPAIGLADLEELVSRKLASADVEGSLQASLTLGTQGDEEYREELAQRQVVHDELLKLMEAHNLDALAYPTIREIAALQGEEQMGTNCRLAANSGLPAISVPAGFVQDMPVGLELLGRPFAEQTLLNLAHTVETHFPQRRPPSLAAQ